MLKIVLVCKGVSVVGHDPSAWGCPMQRINIIGTGRVGTAFGRLFKAYNLLQIAGLFDTKPDAMKTATRHIGEGRAYTHLADLPEADVYMLSVPDDHIAPLATQIQSLGLLYKPCIVCHCSGALPAAQLSVLRQKGVYLASLHPVMSISKHFTWPAVLSDLFMTLEGDNEACGALLKLLTPCGVRVLSIPCEEKLRYHIALVFASNYLVSLMDIGKRLLQPLGLAEKDILAMLRPLAMMSVDQATRIGPYAALTGPIARGDTELVKKHIDWLREQAPSLVDVYKKLATQTRYLALEQRT